MSKTPPKDASDSGAAELATLEDENFLARWSRRKVASREGIELPEPIDAVADDSESRPVDEQEGEAPAAAQELPPIESLGEDSDYSAFLDSGVSVDLQRKALRKLFQSPKFNVRDGLDDYDLDFSSPEPLGDIVTAEMRRRLRAEFERLVGLDDNDSAAKDGDRDAAIAEGKIAGSEAQDQSADSEPDDDQPATA